MLCLLRLHTTNTTVRRKSREKSAWKSDFCQNINPWPLLLSERQALPWKWEHFQGAIPVLAPSSGLKSSRRAYSEEFQAFPMLFSVFNRLWPHSKVEVKNHPLQSSSTNQPSWNAYYISLKINHNCYYCIILFLRYQKEPLSRDMPRASTYINQLLSFHVS